MTPNEKLVDTMTRHQIFVQRYAGGEFRRVFALLKEMISDVNARLIAAESLSQAKKLTTELAAITDLLDDGLSKMESGILSNMDDLVKYEAEFAVKALTTVSGLKAALPEDSALTAILTNRPMRLVTDAGVDFVTVGNAASAFSRKSKVEVLRAIQNGWVNGSAVQDMVRELTSITRRKRNQAEALVRTAVNHIGAEARDASFEANGDIIVGRRYVATLDSRTTLGCASLDGEVFKTGENAPSLPRHWNCRSVYVPVLDPKFTGTIKGKGRASRGDSGKTEYVSGKTTYSGFLKRQSKDFQVEVLGEERAKLFRSGKVTLDKFVDSDGRTLSLDQLRAREGLTL